STARPVSFRPRFTFLGKTGEATTILTPGASDGVIVLKAQQYRTQEQNRADALLRLSELIVNAAKVEKKRRPTRPTLGSKTRRLESKSKRGSIKAGRGKVDF
ncbi:aminoacyl-tRNA hydrolase, partial [Pseudomonas syringae group genomosp. 3]|uniref:aminoacyl-tRNA hydrolase n=1 Tax=Pseudomonas syringae group genomosp. 3 TaxID=251701 RepID=UPI00288C7C89